MKRLVYILFLLIISVHCLAQEKKLSFQFDRILFRDLADTVEKVVPVRIYYSRDWVDTLRLKVGPGEKSVSDMFRKSLLNSGFSFFIPDGNRMIIIKGFIKTNFSEEYENFLRYRVSSDDSVKYSGSSANVDKSSLNDELKVFRIGNPSAVKKGGTAFLTGTIINNSTNEPVNGGVVYVDKLKAGAVTNISGYYSLELPKGQYQVEYRMIGMNTVRRNIIIYSTGVLDVAMTENTSQLNEVTVSADKENDTRNARMGIERISIKMLKQLPLGLGEADLIKSSLLLPGVQTVGEASGGFNIRGGSTDQNLILFDGAPIINSSHFFGFFSAFNSDIIDNVTLYKSGIPAKYGGRISSVMDITLKEGSRDKINVSGGISPFAGRLMVEGPLLKKSSSFIISSRTTYSDWLLGKLKDVKLQKSSAGFYDLEGMLVFNLNKKNSISVSGYTSNDNFDYYREFGLNYSNLASSIRFYHTFSPKFFSEISGIISNYNYELRSYEDASTSNSLKYKFDQTILRANFTYFPNDRHKVEFGLDATRYTLSPGKQVPLGVLSVIEAKTLEKENALEPSVYISDEFEISPRLLFSGGLRATLFTSLGPKTRFLYGSGATRSVDNIIDTLYYRNGKILQFYPGFEYRTSVRFMVTLDFSIKAGVQRNYQYLNMISNTTSVSPTDVWKLSDYYIKPQRGDQFSVGMYKTFSSVGFDMSLEGYYKILKNIIDYKSGAQLLMNEHLETDILNGRGKAYGVEFMIRKSTGKLTGWIGYTYSRSFLKFNSSYSEERINGGNYFPANFDKPHDVKVVANLKIIRRLNITTNLVYNTGRPITYPVAYYNFDNGSHIFYSDRNEFRIPDYLRLDFSATLIGNLRARKLNHSSLTMTVYNALGRKNPYSVFFKVEDGTVKGYQMSIFGKPVFMLTYNFRIRGNASTDF